jgi:hypothetical protein
LVGIGEKDLQLMKQLVKAGTDHSKFMRMITVTVDITAPLYWWKEFDTYKIGTVSNSTSTMHKITSKPITIDCFETDDYDPNLEYLEGIDDTGDRPFKYKVCIADIVEGNGLNSYYEPMLLNFLEDLRLKYIETKDKRYWKELIRWLPESWLQTRTITMNYENALNIINQRENHKLSEWHYLINQFREQLPYSKELLFEVNNEL